MLRIILIIFIVLFSIFYYFKIKYRNPYTFTFIWGKKGSGKTCMMVHLMLKYLKKGWTIYSDIEVGLPGIRIIKNTDEMFKKYTPAKHSVIFLDELGATWNNRRWDMFASEIADWFRYERKYMCRVYANSQSLDYDKSLRDKTDALILQTNIGNVISVSKPIIRKITLTDPSFTGESKPVDQLVFASPLHYKIYFMPRYFKYFNSFDAPVRPPMPYTLSECKPDYKKLRHMGFSKKVALAIIAEYKKESPTPRPPVSPSEAPALAQLGELQCSLESYDLPTSKPDSLSG